MNYCNVVHVDAGDVQLAAVCSTVITLPQDNCQLVILITGLPLQNVTVCQINPTGFQGDFTSTEYLN